MRRKTKKFTITNQNIERIDFSRSKNILFIRNSQVTTSSFESTNLEGLKVKDSTLNKVNMTKCNLNKSKFVHSNLARSNMEWSNLANNTSYRSNLSHTNLQCTSLKNSTINESYLISAVKTGPERPQGASRSRKPPECSASATVSQTPL